VLPALMTAGAAALAAIGSALVVPRRLRPDATARVTALLAVTGASAFLWMLVLVAGTALAELHGVAERIMWCSDYIATHRDSLTPSGIFALGGLAGVFVSTAVVRRRQCALRADPHAGELTIVVSEHADAFALPGRPGEIVVTTGMLRALDPAERRVLLAHEHAHLRLGHHRYLRATELAVAVLPALHPMLAKVRQATERWADEEAARAVGDRALVARAIARAALAAPASAKAQAFTGDDVVGRVQAMLTEPPVRSLAVVLRLGVVGAGLLASTAASVVLVHHGVVALLGHCG